MPRADCPYRLIRDFDLVYSIIPEPLQRRLKLPCDDFKGLFTLSFIERFADTHNRPHTLRNNRRNLFADHVVAFIKDMPSFGMAKYHEFAAELL